MSLPRVLMVDNNHGDQQLLCLAFEDAGIPVHLRTADDGVEGKQVLQKMADGTEPICCVVLLDLNMPRLDGRELLAWARNTPGLINLPIIVLTSSQVKRDQEDCLAGGATGFQVKPGDFNEFVKFVVSLRPHLEHC